MNSSALSGTPRVQGFSLLELMVVIAILGLVFSLSAAQLSAPSETQLLRLETRKVISHLRAVRAQALSHSRIFVVEMNEEEIGYAVSPSGETLEVPEGMTLTITPDATGSEAGITTISSAVRFYPDGSAGGGTISLSTENEMNHLIVNWMTGEISLSEKSGGVHATET